MNLSNPIYNTTKSSPTDPKQRIKSLQRVSSLNPNFHVEYTFPLIPASLLLNWRL